MTSIRMSNALGGAIAMVGWISRGPSPDDSAFGEARARVEILEIENSWAQIALTGDPTVVESIFADDFVGLGPGATPYTNQQFIDDTKANPLEFTSTRLGEVNVRFRGDTAVAKGSEDFTRKDGGQVRFVWTDVLARRDGGWRLVAAEDVVAPVEGSPAATRLFAGARLVAEAVEAIAKCHWSYASTWQAS
jgi:hypothetical protein